MNNNQIYPIDKNTIFAIYHHDEAVHYILFDDHDDYEAFEHAILDILNLRKTKSCLQMPFVSLAFYANSFVYLHKYSLPKDRKVGEYRKIELLTSYYVDGDSFYYETRLPVFSSDYSIIGYFKDQSLNYSYETDDEWVDDPNGFGFNEVNSGNA